MGGSGGGGHAFQTESIKARKKSTSNGKTPKRQSLALGHYRHPVSGQSYRHPISGQSYRHPVSGQSYRHPISGQLYRHPVSGQSYRHPISRQRSTCRFQLTKLATAEGEKALTSRLETLKLQTMSHCRHNKAAVCTDWEGTCLLRALEVV